jgi:hypothetical protein
MENFEKKKASFINDLNTQEKILYGALGVVLIFGFLYFILPIFNTKDKPISLAGRCGFNISSDNLRIEGWAFDGDTLAVSPDVKVHLLSENRKNEIVFNIDPNRVPRPDVVKGLNNPNAGMSGFGVIIPRELVAPGIYSIVLEQISAEGIRVFCSTIDGPFQKIRIN